MTLTLTRMNVTRTGYTKCDDQKISLSQSGKEALDQIIADTRERKKAPRAWSFGIYDTGDMSKATWRASTAIVLPYQITSDVDACHEQILVAANQLMVGAFVIDAEERHGQRTVAVVIPTSEPINELRHARLTGVFWDEMRALGCSLHMSPGASAMTHQLHIHARSEVVWLPGPVLNAKAKIKATEKASQNLDRDRFTVGAQAAQVQVEKPVLTACDDGLFEW